MKTDGPQAPSPKEQKEILTKIDRGERFPVVERKAEVEPGVKDWLTQLETGEEIQLPQPVRDQGGQVLVKPIAPQQPKIILPLDNQAYLAGFKKTVADSVRWLVEWMKRVILIFPDRVVFKK